MSTHVGPISRVWLAIRRWGQCAGNHVARRADRLCPCRGGPHLPGLVDLLPPERAVRYDV